MVLCLQMRLVGLKPARVPLTGKDLTDDIFADYSVEHCANVSS